MNLGQVSGRQAALFTAFLDNTHHPGQGRLDIEQGTGDVHQDRVVRFALALRQALDHRQLINDDLARLTEAEHRQGVGDLPQRGQQAVEVRGVLTVAAHEQVQALLDPHQLLAQRGQHRAHGVTVGPGQARALFIDHGTVWQGFIEPITIFQGLHLCTGVLRLGDIKQQALEQFRRGGLIDARHPLLKQALELLVGLLEQTAQRRTVADAPVVHAFDQGRSHLPQGAERSIAAQRLKTAEDLGQVTEVGPIVLFAQQTDQAHLQHLPHLAQDVRQVHRRKQRQLRIIQRRQILQLRTEQAGFR
ncbi:hypothetical protein D3C84_312180 [compost metagenome]